MSDQAIIPTERDPRGETDSLQLAEQLRKTVIEWQTHNRFAHLAEAQRIRACFHKQRNGTGVYGIDADGKKDVFPWAGAPDGDSLLVDQMIREEVDIHMLAWWMGQRSVKPRDVMNDEGHRKSEAWRHFLDFQLDQTEQERADQLELFWNCMAEVNCCVWYEGWTNQWRLGRKSMAFSDLMTHIMNQMADAYAEAAQPPPPDLEDMVTGSLLEELFNKEAESDLVGRVQEVDPLCSEKEARKLIKEWRKGTQGKVDYFAPIPEPGHSSVRAMIPGIHCIWPVLTEHHQNPPMTFFEWHRGEDIRAMAVRDKWDPDWTKEFLEKCQGMVVDWSLINNGGWGTYDGFALNGLDFSNPVDVNSLKNADLYQIAITWDWGVDKEHGLPAPFKTIHSGRMDGVALTECDPLGTGKMPWRLENREVRSSYRADFRGIPHLLNSHQVIEKQLTDGITAQSLLRAGPPVLDTMDSSADGLKPFARLSGDSRVASRGGKVEFMQVPDVSPEVILWTQRIRERVDHLMMRGGEVDPDAKRARRTRQLHRACMFYRSIQLLLCHNARRDLQESGTLTLGSVNGKAVNTQITVEDLDGELDVQHKCDVSAMDIELAEKKLDMLAKVLGFDRYGITDFNKLYRILVGWVDADIASAALTTLEQATDREKGETETLISKIVSGNIMTDELSKDAGNPQMRIELLQQWGGLAENAQLMQQRPLVAEQMQKLLAHYQFQIDQQQKNAAIGRVQGVNPELKNALPAAGQGQQ